MTDKYIAVQRTVRVLWPHEFDGSSIVYSTVFCHWHLFGPHGNIMTWILSPLYCHFMREIHRSSIIHDRTLTFTWLLTWTQCWTNNRFFRYLRPIDVQWRHCNGRIWKWEPNLLSLCFPGNSTNGKLKDLSIMNVQVKIFIVNVALRTQSNRNEYVHVCRMKIALNLSSPSLWEHITANCCVHCWLTSSSIQTHRAELGTLPGAIGKGWIK